MPRHRPALLVFLGIFLAPAILRWPDTASIHGQVVDANGPVAGAQVRWQGEATFVVSGADGRIRIRPLATSGRPLTASKPGYRIASAIAKERPVKLRLEPLPTIDNEDYAWISPHPNAAQPAKCGNCHTEIYREWAGSAHARAARNPRLLQIIADPDGKSPPGWDLSREHPLGVGVCAACHAPTLDDDDLHGATGVAADGVHCDYCHKIAGALTDRSGTRFGRDGLDLLRPRKGDALFLGPLPDAIRPGESFAQLPLYRESRACASCHEGVIFGVHVYGTYSEWLESPAAKQGIQCQGCHMAPTGRLTNIAPGHGGIARDPHTLASHGFPGSAEAMLRGCLHAEVRCRPQGDGMRVDVTVHADNVGHRVPTGFIDRHLLLVVQAFDAAGKSIALKSGPRLPTAAGKWTGAPGWLYGKVLHDAKRAGPVPFWLPGLDMDDTRLMPGRPDLRSFVFEAPSARVEARLWYRRFWQQIADARGWRDNDVLVWQQTVTP